MRRTKLLILFLSVCFYTVNGTSEPDPPPIPTDTRTRGTRLSNDRFRNRSNNPGNTGDNVNNAPNVPGASLFIEGTAISGGATDTGNNPSSDVQDNQTTNTGGAVVKQNDAAKNSATSSNDVIVINENNENATSKCPVFNTRYEKNDLIVEIEPDVCELVATIKATRMPLLKSNRRQKSKNKKKDNIKFRPYYHPVVSYRAVNRTTDNDTTTTTLESSTTSTCVEFEVKPLGPYVVVESVPGQCQFVIGVVREKKTFLSRLRGSKKTKTLLAIEYINEILL